MMLPLVLYPPPSFEAVYCYFLQLPKSGCCSISDALSCSLDLSSIFINLLTVKQKVKQSKILSSGLAISTICGLVDVIFHRQYDIPQLLMRVPFKIRARRGGAEVAGWTLDRKIRVRFPAYPHRVWAL